MIGRHDDDELEASMEQAQASGEDIAEIERQILELATQAVRAAQERTDAENAFSAARLRCDAVAAQLPAAEALAKKRRQARHDAVRDRAEIERRLSALLEEENSARSRRRQAEQLAEGFRSAEAFAAMSGSEAQAGGDGDRMVREHSVASRARLEAQQAEARVAELRSIEAEITKAREEVEGHVLAEREFEAKLAGSRDEAETEAASLRAELLSAKHALDEAREALERLDHEARRVVDERSNASQRLTEGRLRARAEIEERIRDLRERERALTAQRIEAEKLLAALLQAENRANAEVVARERGEAKRLNAERNERFRIEREERERAEREAQIERDAVAAPSETNVDGATQNPSGDVKMSANGTSHGISATAAGDADADALPKATPNAPLEAGGSGNANAAQPIPNAASPDAAHLQQGRLQVPTPPSDASSSEPSPLMRSLIGLFARRTKPVVEEPALDGPSIADRIARDFGALGNDPTPPSPKPE